MKGKVIAALLALALLAAAGGPALAGSTRHAAGGHHVRDVSGGPAPAGDPHGGTQIGWAR